MPGLDCHLRTIDAEDHARLAFRRDCPHCRRRFAGPPPSGDVVPARAKAALATAAVLASGALPAASASAQDEGGDQVAEIEPPSGAEPGGDSDAPISPPDGADDAAPESGGTSSADETAPPAGSGSEESSGGSTDDSSSGGASSGGSSEPAGDSSPGGDSSSGGASSSGGSSSDAAGGDDNLPVAPPGVMTPPTAGADERASDGAASSRGDGRESRDDEREAGAGKGDSGKAQDSGGDKPDAGPGAGGKNEAGEPGAQSREAPGAQEARARGDRYAIERGDCLWSIARDVLGEEASDARVAAKVSKLWDRNDEVIRTGDPDLIYPGQELRLR